MPPTLEPPTETRKPRGPEPLRRKRVQPVPASNASRRRVLNMVLGFAAVVLLVDALVGEKGFMDRLRANRTYQQEAAKLDALRRVNAELRAQIIRLDTDPAAVEEIARREMGLMKRGELLFIIRDARAGTPARPTLASQPVR
jgi:cell division protein FtsB